MLIFDCDGDVPGNEVAPVSRLVKGDHPDVMFTVGQRLCIQLQNESRIWSGGTPEIDISHIRARNTIARFSGNFSIYHDLDMIHAPVVNGPPGNRYGPGDIFSLSGRIDNPEGWHDIWKGK